MRLSIISLFFIIPLITNAQQYISSNIEQNTYVKYIEGNQWVYKDIRNVTVGMTNYYEKNNYGKFYILALYIYNNSSRAINVFPEHISSIIEKKSGKIDAMKVYSCEDFLKKVKRKDNLTLFSAGFNHGNSINGHIYGMMLKDRISENRESIDDLYLKATTLNPGEHIIGYVYIKREKGSFMTINFPIENRIFKFKWDIRK